MLFQVKALLHQLLLRLGLIQPGKIMYIGGSDTLPPPLKREEESELLTRMVSGEEQVKQILIERNLRLVVYIARRFENTGINIEDLISIGTIGLIKAINTYRTDKNIKLATYASRCIENEILMSLRSEKKQLLAMMDYAEDTGLSTVRKDISAMEANLARLEQQEKKYTTELNAALAEYAELKTQASDFDPDELAMAQLEIRPQKEASAESRVQAAYGDKYDFWTMIGAKREVAELLGEEEPRSIWERLRRKEYEKQRTEKQELPQRKKNKDRGWER